MIKITAGMDDGSLPDRRSVHDLRASLDAAGITSPAAVGAPGDKGAVTDILVNPATPVAIMAAVRVLRLWMQRDRRRSLTLSRTSKGKDECIVISGTNISIETIESALTEMIHPGEKSIADMNTGRKSKVVEGDA